MGCGASHEPPTEEPLRDDDTQQYVVTASEDKTARIWNATTGACVRALKGHKYSVWSCAFSPDGAQVVTASTDKTAKVWDASTGACVRTLHGHKGTVSSCAFSPDGAQIVTASWDNTAKVWDASTGACVRTLDGHTRPVMSCAFCPSQTNAPSPIVHAKSSLSILPAKNPQQSTKEAAIINAPGRWDVFISHTQRNANAKLLASELFSSLKEHGITAWLDVKMKKRDERAMREGVRNSTICVAIISDGDGADDTAYFKRDFCLKELRWAVEAGIFVQPVIDIDDKKRIGEFMHQAPEDLKFLGGIDFLELYRVSIDIWNTCVNGVVEVLNERKVSNRH